MIRIALLALAVLLVSPARAQSPSPLPDEAGVRARPSLDALRHHQPRQAAVEQRERERFGRDETQKRGRQSEVDRLYDEVLKRSAPAKGP